MAEVTVLRNPDTGEMVANVPGSEQFVPITEDELEILNENGAESFFNSLGNSLQQVGSGLGVLMGSDTARTQFDRLQDRQELRSMERPVISTAGSIAPDIALGAATGGTGTIARRVGLTAAVEGGIGATRNPDAPLQGAAIQGGLGAAGGGAGPLVSAGIRQGQSLGGRLNNTMVGRVVSTLRESADQARATRAAKGRLDEANDAAAAEARSRIGQEGRDLSAAGAGPQRHRSDLMSEDELQAYVSGPAVQLTDAQHGALHAGDRADFDLFKTLADEEEVASRSDLPALQTLIEGELPDYGQVKRGLQENLDRTVARELGLDPGEGLMSVDAVGTRMDEISDEMDKLERKAGPVNALEEVDITRGPGDPDPKNLVEELKRVTSESLPSPTAKEVARQVIDLVSAKIDNDGMISARNASLIRNRITKRMNQAYKGQSDTEVGDLMQEFRQRFSNRAESKLTPADRERWRELGGQWNLAKALVDRRGGLSPDGQINVRSLISSLGSQNNMFKRGRLKGDLDKFLRTMEFLLQKRTGDSGTGTTVSRSELYKKGQAVLPAAGAALGAGVFF